MREKARLIIPCWGVNYLHKLLNVTIPALLAPGNLPALIELFDVEVVLVTSEFLFPSVRGDLAYQNLTRHCPVESSLG